MCFISIFSPLFVLSLMLLKPVMRRFIIALLLCCSVISGAFGKSFHKFAIQKTHPQGMLFFVFPQKATAVHATTIKSVKFDFTFLSANSYVTFLSTLKSNSAIKVDSVAIGIENKLQTLSQPTELFRDIKGNKRVLRLQATLNKTAWQQAFTTNNMPLVVYYLSDGTKQTFHFPYGNGTKKHYTMLFELINATK